MIYTPLRFGNEPSRTVGVCNGDGAAEMKHDSTVSITLEAIDSGDNLPPWLIEALCSGDAANLLVVHPNEASRNQTLIRLSQIDAPVDTTHHLTLQRLAQLLILDLGLPPLLDDEAGTFAVVHAHTKLAAENGDLPLLFSAIEGRKWSPFQTERVLMLHRTLTQLNQPWAWEEDPGARDFDKILNRVELTLSGTHPHHALHVLTQALLQSEYSPFTLNDVDGIVLLNTAPDFTEIERSFYQQLSRHRPIHQLCCAGSFRLGHHGAYLFEAEWEYVTQKNLPEWLPKHEVWKPTANVPWCSRRGIERQTSLHRVTLERCKHSMDAAIELLRSFSLRSSGTVLIIDGAAESNLPQWHSRIKPLGFTCGAEKVDLEHVPAVSGLLRAMKLGIGMEAWSLQHLRVLYEHNSLPLINGAVESLNHPSERTWAPRPHPEILENIARSFHVRGGLGSLSRWLAILAQATPQLGENPERQRQALEETQWWMHCVARIWAPLIDDESRRSLEGEAIGCSSGQRLPLPPRLKTGAEWLDAVYQRLNWGDLTKRTALFDRSLAGLQMVKEAFQTTQGLLEKANLHSPKNGEQFIQHFEQTLSRTSLPRSRSRGKNVLVLTPEKALGVEADLILLVGLDVNSWTMKASKVPWLDAPAQLRLGLFSSDLTIRQGRHHLRHLLNAGSEIIVFDTSAEEGGGPSAPLAEWLAETRADGTLSSFNQAPSFLDEQSHQEGNPHRSWHWTNDEHGGGNVWLTPRPFTMSMRDGRAVGERGGRRGRDVRQRSGLELGDGGTPEAAVLSNTSLALAHELELQNDRHLRQPVMKNLDNGDYFTWENRHHLLSVDGIILQPTKSQVGVGSSQQKHWPHLGLKVNSRSRGPAIDPRPLPGYTFPSEVLNSTLGLKSSSIKREKWSQSRLQSWLQCPRKAWMDTQLKARAEETLSEDLESRTRGTLIHDTEAALLRSHGIPTAEDAVSSPLPLHLGPNNSVDALWGAVLTYLSDEVPWLTRYDAVAVHRCREMIGVTPAEWRLYLEGEHELEPSGRIGRMIESDFALTGVGPLACEWAFSSKKGNYVNVDGVDDLSQPVTFNLSGRVDRVDAIVLDPEMRTQAIKDGVLSASPPDEPLSLEHPSAASRFVIIRDLKTVNGPKFGDKGDRHRKALFDEVQLGLYARAWEQSHPGDRVVGVGVSEIGESTTHYVEIDSSILKYIGTGEIGERTMYTQNHHRMLGTDFTESNGFRAWIQERIRTANRAIETAANGSVNPTPGKHCSYCSVRQICPSATLGGEVN